MTVEGVLFSLLPVGLVLSWAVTGVLLYGAWRRPRITALTMMALFSLLISTTITVYVWAVANAALGYPVPKELAQIALRALFVAFVVLQVVFLWAYAARRFGDGVP